MSERDVEARVEELARGLRRVAAGLLEAAAEHPDAARVRELSTAARVLANDVLARLDGEAVEEFPAHQVDSREALAAHVLALRDDLLARGAEWENATIESYLEALAAWIKDSPGWYRNVGLEMPTCGDWTFVARAMSAAVGYE
ncbi:hypothetical protein ACFQLX_20510 [Streptomyces polyrhachis]|uniref:DUF7660 domain-containing protein n=1 Tax=Streptomyces polyrhachis TaxID=1282885 RepID=A0ABW2GIN0_9ACTN